MAQRIPIDHGNFEAALRKIQHWRVPATVKVELHQFLDDLALGKVNKGKRLSAARRLKYLHALKAPLEFFNKQTHLLTLRDIENLERALASGELANHFTKKPFAHSTQVDLRLLLRVFLRWRLGGTKSAHLTDWLDTRTRAKTPDFLSETEVERLYKHCRSAQQRFLIAVLFDSGARAEEFHNIRFEDVHLPEGAENFLRIALKQEYSKTLGRTIALYWKHSLEAVKDYLNERIAAGIKPSEPVFAGSYSATRKSLQRLGYRVLKRPVHYHLFRHASATYYANKLNRQELCIRYGWKFSSPMPDVYIARSGMQTKALDEKFTQTELGAVNNKLVQMEQASRIRDDQIRQLKESLRQLQLNLSAVSAVISLNPSVTDVAAILQRKSKVKKPTNKRDQT